MTEVALAFSNIDKPRADALARILNAVGYEVAAQPLTPEKVERASAVLAFWSPSSINSQPVQNFASQAAFAKKLVSVRAGPADPPAAFALVTLHDLSSWTGSLDAPELRTLVSHVAKMAPPPQQQQTPTRHVGFGGNSFAGNGFDPYGMPAPAPTPRPAAGEPAALQAVARDATPPRDATPAPANYRDRPARPERRTAEEPRRAAGGGVARMALGAIAVTVMGGGAVAAFNYYEDGKTGTSAADAETGAAILTAEPSAPIDAPPASVADAPAAVAEEAVQVAANTFAAPAASVAAAPTVVAAEPPVTLQSKSGWTASLPSTPPSRTPTMTATPVSGGAATRPQAQQPVRLPPIGTGPQPTDIVAVDQANFGEEDVKPAPAPPQAPERVWQRPDVTYGPDS